jgi:hypothetical protein
VWDNSHDLTIIKVVFYGQMFNCIFSLESNSFCARGNHATIDGFHSWCGPSNVKFGLAVSDGRQRIICRAPALYYMSLKIAQIILGSG